MVDWEGTNKFVKSLTLKLLYSLLQLPLLTLSSPLGKHAACSPFSLLFSFLLDPGIQLGDCADPPDGVLNSLQTQGNRTLEPNILWAVKVKVIKDTVNRKIIFIKITYIICNPLYYRNGKNFTNLFIMIIASVYFCTLQSARDSKNQPGQFHFLVHALA